MLWYLWMYDTVLQTLSLYHDFLVMCVSAVDTIKDKHRRKILRWTFVFFFILIKFVFSKFRIKIFLNLDKIRSTKRYTKYKRYIIQFTCLAHFSQKKHKNIGAHSLGAVYHIWCWATFILCTTYKNTTKLIPLLVGWLHLLMRLFINLFVQGIWGYLIYRVHSSPFALSKFTLKPNEIDSSCIGTIVILDKNCQRTDRVGTQSGCRHRC